MKSQAIKTIVTINIQKWQDNGHNVANGPNVFAHKHDQDRCLIKDYQKSKSLVKKII